MKRVDIKAIARDFTILEVIAGIIVEYISIVCWVAIPGLWILWICLIAYCACGIVTSIFEFDSLLVTGSIDMATNVFSIIFGIPFGTVAGIFGLIVQYKNKKSLKKDLTNQSDCDII